MNETLVSLLVSISDTRGFMVFCLVIAVAYASIWALFLFEAPPKKKKIRPANAEDNEEQEEAKKTPPKRQKQAA